MKPSVIAELYVYKIAYVVVINVQAKILFIICTVFITNDIMETCTFLKHAYAVDYI